MMFSTCKRNTSVIHPKCSILKIFAYMNGHLFMGNLVGKYSIDGAYGNGWGRAFAVTVAFNARSTLSLGDQSPQRGARIRVGHGLILSSHLVESSYLLCISTIYNISLFIYIRHIRYIHCIYIYIHV